ncbi:hypothetical protein [Mumia sp. ZJ430]|uniref:hypothetical protein n=2 Tax=Nocardioidaceae TaxID=85015 RepID=UPI001422A706|nr:hypothetical protein [Mumia sp. ZJ430]
MGGITNTRALPRGTARKGSASGSPASSTPLRRRSSGADWSEQVSTPHSLRLLAGMPAQRDWTQEAVLRRFLGVRAGRKSRYAALLVEALEPDRVPEPLAAVLNRVSARR